MTNRIEIAHTPGPWKLSEPYYKKIGQETRDVQQISESGLQIAIVPIAEHLTETKANAKLLAASPELLRACKFFITAFKVSEELRETMLGEAVKFAIKAVEKTEL